MRIVQNHFHQLGAFVLALRHGCSKCPWAIKSSQRQDNREEKHEKHENQTRRRQGLRHPCFGLTQRPRAGEGLPLASQKQQQNKWERGRSGERAREREREGENAMMRWSWGLVGVELCLRVWRRGGAEFYLVSLANRQQLTKFARHAQQQTRRVCLCGGKEWRTKLGCVL